MGAGQLTKAVQYLRTIAHKQDAAGMTDADLLKRYVRQRDEMAFEALVRRHGAMVLSVCRRVLRNSHDAEDAFQATFLVLVRKAKTLRSSGILANWLYGVAYRTAVEAKRSDRRRRMKESQAAEMPEPKADAHDPWSELRSLLDQELSRLPDKHRAVVLLCDLEGYTRKEAARQLGLPEGTVASRLARGRTMLAKGLVRHGLGLSAGSLAALLSQNGATATVPPSLVTSTAQVAGAFALGRDAMAPVSANVAAIMEGVLKTMLLAKLKVVALVSVGIGCLAISASLVTGALGSDMQGPRGIAPHLPATLKTDAGKPDPWSRLDERSTAQKGPASSPEDQGHRIYRWELSPGTKDGAEYAERLQALGAILVIPNGAKCRVIRDLAKRPVTCTIEDVDTQHIWFVERDVSSVGALSKALGLQPVPNLVVIFLPKFIEDELRRKSLAHAQRRGRSITEDSIEQTSFKLARTESGWDLQVASQTVKK
jgi:RNA polymerase sigma factor (sigma-70 family)